MTRNSRHNSIAKSAFALVLISAAGLILAGCTADQPSTAAPNEAQSDTKIELLKDGEVAEEYLQAIKDFPEPLPEGRAYADGLGPAYEPEDGAMEKGTGIVAAYYAWLCAWEGEYVAAFEADDEDRTQAAIEMIGKWKFLPDASIAMSDPDDDWTKGVLDPAKLGDPSGIRGDLVGTCGIDAYPTVAE